MLKSPLLVSASKPFLVTSFLCLAVELVVLVAVTANEVDLVVDAIGVQLLGRTIDCVPRGLIMSMEDGKFVSFLSCSFDDFFH